VASKEFSILFAGGGTGGHLYPALAIAGEIRKRHPEAEIVFVGTKGRIEERVVPAQGYRFESIWISGFRRAVSFETLLFPVRLVVALAQSWILLRSVRPQVVVGTGGYVSGPVVFAATIMGIPTLIQEQNSYPGVTTRLLASRVDELHVSFDQSLQFLRRKENVKVTGNPTRAEVGRIGKAEGRRYFLLAEERPTILVFGGSQGAHAINMAVCSCLKELASGGIQLLWQTGEADYGMAVAAAASYAKSGVIVLKYIDRMEYAYGACDLAVCRAGATTLSELTTAGVPSVLVPYPFAAADHQSRNARSMTESGASLLIKEENLGSVLAVELKRLLSDPVRLMRMGEKARVLGRPDATAKLADSVLRLAEKNRAGRR
jgi:UDP-N-acetylglucosamine--N-acetylmuramyl-(pentapeptide) pyrophosphoryl-undecaprenol N-acetylglucosamine transferase